MKISNILLVGVSMMTVVGTAAAFVSPTRPVHSSTAQMKTTNLPTKPAESTAVSPRNHAPLYALLNVPDGFFTVTFGVTGLMLSIMRNVHRTRMEELAWEQRLRESRERRMAADPTLTEIDLLRREAENEWSAYGPEAMKERNRKKTKVKELEDDEGDGYRREARMTDEEIEEFEREYGVDYDPYYDDPYDESELPEDMEYRVDKKYGDRIYEDGEVFYKDEESGMYYRQGSKPRIKSFW